MHASIAQLSNRLKVLSIYTPLLVLLSILFFIPGIATIGSKLLLISLVLIVLLSKKLLHNPSLHNEGHISLNPILLSVGVVVLTSLVGWVYKRGNTFQFFGNFETLTPFSIVLMGLTAVVIYIYGKEEKGLLYEKKILRWLFILIPLLHALLLIGSYIAPSVSGWIGQYQSFVGSLTSLALISGLSLLHNISNEKDDILTTLAISSSLFILFLINSLLIWGLVGLGMVMMLYKSRENHGIEGLKIKPMPALVVLIVMFMFFSSGKIGSSFQNYINVSFVDVRPSLQSTVDISKSVITSKSFLLGEGSNNFDNLWQLNRPVVSNATPFWDNSFTSGFSTFTSILPIMGLVGLFGMILLFVSSYSQLKRIKNSSALLDYYLPLTFLLIMGILTNIDSLAMLFIGLYVGFIALQAQGEDNLKSFKIPSVFAKREIILGLRSLVVIFALFLLFDTAVYVYSKKLTYTGNQLAAEGNLVDSEKKLISSVSLIPDPQTFLSLASLYDSRLLITVQQTDISNEEKQQILPSLIKAEMDSINNAIALDPSNYELYISLAQTYSRAIELGAEDASERAFQALDQAQLRAPSHPAIELERARIYLLLKDEKNARKFIDKALLLKSDYLQAGLLLTQIELSQGNTAKALALIEQAIMIDQSNPNLRFQAGLMRYSLEQYDVAANLFASVLSIDPQFANARYLFALSIYKLDLTSEAIKQIEILIKQFPENKELQVVEQNMREGDEALSGLLPPNDKSPENRETLPL